MTTGSGDSLWRSEVDELRRLTQLLLSQVSHWTPARWGSHGDELHDLLQRLVGPERSLPRLSDLVLPDQLRVVVTDLIENGAGPAEIGRAVEELRTFRGTLTSAQ
jgi:hypothetical protein